MDYSHSALPKGRTRKQLKSRRDRLEAKVKRAVRVACVERDGRCRLAHFGGCEGRSEWAHLGEWRRCFTRGKAPDERHHTRGSFMACTRHHKMYDASEIVIDYGPDGANGLLLPWLATYQPCIKADRE